MAKFLVVAFPLLFVWLYNGIWHGSSWKYIAYGMYYYVIMMIGLLLKPFTDNSTSHDNFQLIDTLGKFEQASILKDKLSSQECQFEIYGLLSNGDLTEQELYNKLNTITKMSKSDLESLIAKSLKQLKNKGVIGSEKADNVEHYHLRQDFVQK